MNHTKYIFLTCLLFLISEVLQAGPPGRRLPTRTSKSSSKALEANRLPATPIRATDSIRRSLPDLSQANPIDKKELPFGQRLAESKLALMLSGYVPQEKGNELRQTLITIDNLSTNEEVAPFINSLSDTVIADWVVPLGIIQIIKENLTREEVDQLMNALIYEYNTLTTREEPTNLEHMTEEQFNNSITFLHTLNNMEEIRTLIRIDLEARFEDMSPIQRQMEEARLLAYLERRRVEDATDYIENESGLTRDEINELMVGNLQESFGNNPNQQAAH